MNARRILTAMGGLCAAALLGCVTAADLDAFDEALDEAPVIERDGEVPTVCNDRVQIIRDDSVPYCPDLGQWDGEQLFDVGTPWLANVDGKPVEGVLARYCRYTWTGPNAPTTPQIDGLYNTLGAAEHSPSCRAITPQSSVITDALGETMRDIFHVAAGRASSEDLGLLGTTTLEPLVTVVVIDSQSNVLGVQPTLEHGRHMGNIIGDIACPDDASDCRVEVQYAVGLPRVAGGGTQYLHGGMVGTHEDLAVAIYQGVRQWEQANASRAEPSALVLNLSVAWEPPVFGGDEADPPDAIEAIRDALEVAACKGALIVASVGNQGDYCDVTGPMLPAAWESRPAPDATRCADLGVAMAPVAGEYRPLVHAVGGLGIDGGPMPGARVDADPRLLAASAHAAAGDPLHGGLTGTSVGTAVASGAAALLWSYRPELTAHEVMDWVYAGGEELPGMSADFSMTDTSPSEPHRVDACQALDAACADTTTCSELPLGCLTAEAPPLTDLAVDLATITPTSATNQALSNLDECEDSCGNKVNIHVNGGSPAHCQAFDVDPAEDLVNPTPDSIGCPTCTFSGGTVSMSLHEDLDGAAITSVMVKLIDDQDNTRYYDLGPLTLDPLTRTDVTIDAIQLPPGVVLSGEVIIDFASQRTTSDALLML